MAALLIVISIYTGILGIVAGKHSSGPIKYSYAGKKGPANWGSLDPKYSLCAKGKWQSPIDIPKSEVVRNKNLRPLVRDYHVLNVTLADNVVNVGLHFGENSGVLIADGKQYKLKQMHWHTPSEHSINGVHYNAELHLVHLADDGSYAVVGMLYRLGKPDPVVSAIQNKLPLLAKQSRGNDYQLEIPSGKIKMKRLQKKTRKYYKYNGSFTTPPCSEIVTWYILGKVKSISQEQIQALKYPLVPGSKINSRPVQPLDGRQIEMYEEEIPTKSKRNS